MGRAGEDPEPVVQQESQHVRERFDHVELERAVGVANDEFAVHSLHEERTERQGYRAAHVVGAVRGTQREILGGDVGYLRPRGEGGPAPRRHRKNPRLRQVAVHARGRRRSASVQRSA